MISTIDLKKQYGSKILFEGVSVQFKSGCRYGLIGANGVGKSTFMKIMAGQEESTKGEVAIDQNRRMTGTLDQHAIHLAVNIEFISDRIQIFYTLGNILQRR